MPNSAAKSAAKSAAPIAIHLVSEADWPACRAGLPPLAAGFAASLAFEPKSGRILALPGEGGGLSIVLMGIGEDQGLSQAPFLLGKLATDLPAGNYAISTPLADPTMAYLGFLLGAYRFERFKAGTARGVHLEPPAGADAARARNLAEATISGRDLINRPANDLTTEALAEAAFTLAERFGAKASAIIGEALLQEGFPMIHAVGRASAHAPRLVHFTWGDSTHPKLTLVGKGVVFDTGGLNLKPDASMLLMKKDMGGAASALSAAQMIMAEGLKLRLRVILPIVENSVAGAAFRPGDILRSRAGLSVEIGNTDAEGRLILADALAFADEEAPDLLLDFATLTGAARVALGPDLPPFYTPSDALAAKIMAAGAAMQDPVWRLPLWQPYLSMLESKAADMNNVSSGGFAGSITAALFLKQFVKSARDYAHFDIYGWTPSARPGRPEGGEPQAARLAAHLARALAEEGAAKPTGH